MNPLGLLVMLGIFALVLYGITMPAFMPRNVWPHTFGRWVAATIAALAITLAIYALIMFQTGVWKTF